MPQPDLPEEETAKAAEPEKKKEEKGLLNNLF